MFGVLYSISIDLNLTISRKGALEVGPYSAGRPFAFIYGLADYLESSLLQKVIVGFI